MDKYQILADVFGFSKDQYVTEKDLEVALNLPSEISLSENIFYLSMSGILRFVIPDTMTKEIVVENKGCFNQIYNLVDSEMGTYESAIPGLPYALLEELIALDYIAEYKNPVIINLPGYIEFTDGSKAYPGDYVYYFMPYKNGEAKIHLRMFRLTQEFLAKPVVEKVTFYKDFKSAMESILNSGTCVRDTVNSCRVSS